MIEDNPNDNSVSLIQKLSFFEKVLLIMALILFLIIVGFFVALFIVEKVPTIFSDEQISKPLIDNKKYEIIRLHNGMEVALISEPEASIASLALSLALGSSSDVKYSLYGLGSLVQRVIIGGEFNKLSTHNSNYFGHHFQGAMYHLDQTFAWEVATEGFGAAIEIFSQMIKLNVTGDELETKIIAAVEQLNKEMEKNIWANKEVSINNILFELFDLKMKYNPFGLKQTFINETFTVKDLSKAVMKYYNDNYIGPKMKMAVSSRLTLKEMRGIVIKLFSDLPWGDADLAEEPVEQPFLPKSDFKLGKLSFLSFKNFYSFFRASFAFNGVPYAHSMNFFRYLSYLFAHQRENSLMRILQRSYNSISLTMIVDHVKEDTLVFTVFFILGEKGYSGIDNVIYLLTNFLKLVRQNKSNRELYEDMKKVQLINYRFREANSNTLDFIMHSARNMIKFKSNLTLFQMGNDYIPEYNETIIEAMLSALLPEKMNILVSIPFFPHPAIEKLKEMFTGDLAFKEDAFGQVQYATANFTEWQLKTMTTISLYDSVLTFRKKNNFLTNLTELVEPDKEETGKSFKPKKILDLNHLQVWHKEDKTVKVPMVYGSLIINSPFYPFYNERQYFYFKFQQLFLEEGINLELNEAKEAGSVITIQEFDSFLEIKIKTFSDLLERIVAIVTELYFQMKTSLLGEDLIDRQVKAELNKKATKVFYQKSTEIFKTLIKNQFFVYLTPNVKDQPSTKFISTIKSLIQHSYFRVLLYGNIKESAALDNINSYIKPHIDLKSYYFGTKYWLEYESNIFAYLEEQKSIQNIVIYRIRGDGKTKNSFVGNYFYMGSSLNYEDHILFHLMKATLDYEFNLLMKGLNQKFNLAFGLHFGVNYYYSILVYSDDPNSPQDPKTINDKSDRFFESVEKKLASISDDDLYKIKLTLVSQMTKKDANLQQKAERMSQAIKLNKEFGSSFDYSIEVINKNFTKEYILKRMDEIFRTKVRNVSIQKNYTQFISMEDDGYVLNKGIRTVVTDDIEYFHK